MSDKGDLSKNENPGNNTLRDIFKASLVGILAVVVTKFLLSNLLLNSLEYPMTNFAGVCLHYTYSPYS